MKCNTGNPAYLKGKMLDYIKLAVVTEEGLPVNLLFFFLFILGAAAGQEQFACWSAFTEATCLLTCFTSYCLFQNRS